MTQPELDGSDSTSDTSSLIRRMSAGDEHARNELHRRIDGELRGMAHWMLSKRRRDPHLTTSELVQRVHMRLLGERSTPSDRAHVLAIAATVMRRELLDDVKARERIKRGRNWVRVDLDLDQRSADGACEDIELLDDALERLAQLNAIDAQIAEMKLYGEAADEEIAIVVELPPDEVGARCKRAYQFLRGWIQRNQNGSGENRASPDRTRGQRE